jgi:hypothetical protein
MRHEDRGGMPQTDLFADRRPPRHGQDRAEAVMKSKRTHSSIKLANAAATSVVRNAIDRIRSTTIPLAYL